MVTFVDILLVVGEVFLLKQIYDDYLLVTKCRHPQTSLPLSPPLPPSIPISPYTPSLPLRDPTAPITGINGSCPNYAAMVPTDLSFNSGAPPLKGNNYASRDPFTDINYNFVPAYDGPGFGGQNWVGWDVTADGYPNCEWYFDHDITAGGKIKVL